jgi:hypothetical protein
VRRGSKYVYHIHSTLLAAKVDHTNRSFAESKKSIDVEILGLPRHDVVSMAYSVYSFSTGYGIHPYKLMISKIYTKSWALCAGTISKLVIISCSCM